MKVNWICELSAVLLLFAMLPGLPLAYFVILRWTVFISSLYLAYKIYPNKTNYLSLVLFCIAFLFNPIWPVVLPKTTWIPIDFIVALLFLFISNKLSKAKS